MLIWIFFWEWVVFGLYFYSGVFLIVIIFIEYYYSRVDKDRRII